MTSEETIDFYEPEPIGGVSKKDVYRSDDTLQRFRRSQDDLTQLLRDCRIERIIIPCGEPIRLIDYEEIVGKCNDHIEAQYDGHKAISAKHALESFLKKEILGVHPFNHKKINWQGPVEAPLHTYLVYATESWLIDDFVISTAIFGFTDPEKTHIQHQESMLKKHGLEYTSAAFTFHKGFYVPLGLFYNSVGRNWDVDTEQARSWFERNKFNPVGIYRSEEEQSYSSTPFATPIDPIFYPWPNEFGCSEFYDKRYLTLSLNAKSLIKTYFEEITGKSHPVYESIVKNNLDF